MAYDLQEQEQIDALKAFWNRYGVAILSAITVALLIFAGVRGWNIWQARQAEQAAAVYGELATAVQAKKLDQVKQRSEDLLRNHGSTVYGPMGGLMTARAYVEAKDTAGARQALQWVIDNAKDDVFRGIARLRLAGLLLDDKAYDDALKLVDAAAAAKPAKDLAGALADRRADILVAQGNVTGARSDYERALSLLPANSPLRPLIEMKRDALAG